MSEFIKHYGAFLLGMVCGAIGSYHLMHILGKASFFIITIGKGGPDYIDVVPVAHQQEASRER